MAKPAIIIIDDHVFLFAAADLNAYSESKKPLSKYVRKIVLSAMANDDQGDGKWWWYKMESNIFSQVNRKKGKMTRI